MRLRHLDFLRGLAVILVLFRHHAFINNTHNAGWIGVDLFFVLSGYLVSGLLFEEYMRTKHLRVGRFLWRRALKIYPAFWVMLLATLIVASFGFTPNISIDGLVGELFFIQNYVGNIWMHTWTLAVE